MFYLKKFKVTLILMFLALISSLVYISQTSTVYEAVSEVLILRASQETNLKVNEETRNRWVWARDGLALKKAMISEGVLDKMMKLPSAAEFVKGKSKYEAQKALLKMINVEYTGADEFAFFMRVRGANQDLILAMNKILFDQLKYNYITLPKETYQAAVDVFEAKANTTYLKEKLAELRAVYSWEMKVREETWRVLKSPVLIPEKVWPKKSAIVIAFLFIAMLLGSLIDGALVMKGAKS